MQNTSPNPSTTFPLVNYDRLCFLKNIVTNPNIQVGDFTYYDDFALVGLADGENHPKCTFAHWKFRF